MSKGKENATVDIGSVFYISSELNVVNVLITALSNISYFASNR